MKGLKYFLGRFKIVNSNQLFFQEFGKPNEILQFGERSFEFPSEEKSDVLVRMVSSPLNPADINVMEGTYGRLPDCFPCIGGNEGVGIVEQLPTDYDVDFEVGDVVIPIGRGIGCWSEWITVQAEELMKIPNPERFSFEELATIRVNPLAAYLMLTDYVDLNEGDWVIQNGSNSMVGRLVIQLCKAMNLKTINLIRGGESFEEKRDTLLSLGADVVLSEEDFNIKDLSELIGGEGEASIRLGLNCVGGDSAKRVVRSLSTDGVMVTYGGMSFQPVTASTSSLIFKNISYRGFWVDPKPIERKIEAVHAILEFMERGEIKTDSFVHFSLEEGQKALDYYFNRGKNEGKVLFQIAPNPY